MAGLHGGTVPTNGGRAKCDVMCADRFPLLTEDECLLPPQHREPEAILPSCPGGLGEMSESVRVSLCNRQRGQSKRPPSKELVLHPKLMGLLGTVRGVSPLCFSLALPQWTEEVAH